MRPPLTTVLLAGLIAVALGACASSRDAATSTTNATTTTGTPSATTTGTPSATTTGTASSPPTGAPTPVGTTFPLTLPSQTIIAFSLRATTSVLVGSQQQHRSIGEALAVTRNRTGYVACRAGAPLHPVGTLSPATVSRFTALLASTHLATIRSDPVRDQGRFYWFSNGTRTVTLDFARHVRRAPCRGTMCAAMINMDATLRGVVPATVAFTTFIGSHCAGA